jgi:transcriptional regulator with XRE-family HTH domain
MPVPVLPDLNNTMRKDRGLFGGLLHQWRTETLNLSLEEFTSKLSGCGFVYSVSAIARYERGERTPGGEFIAHLAICFNLTEESAVTWLETLSIEYLSNITSDYMKTMLFQ